MFKINQIKVLFVILVLSFVGFTQSAFALSPPWYILRALLKSSLETDSCVKVGHLTGEGRNMQILIDVCDVAKARAMSTLISKKHSFGENILVSVNVMAANQIILPSPSPMTTNEWLMLVNEAFTGNSLFVKAAGANTSIGVVELKPAIVQYFADDISDWYRNTNLVAAEAFKRILDINTVRRAGMNVHVTTSRMNANN